MSDVPATDRSGDGDGDLIELGGTTPIGLYLRELWARREFAVVVPANDIRAQNMDNTLGQLWHLLNPMMLVGVYLLIFGVVLDANRGVENYLGFLVIGVLLFQLTQRVVQDAAMAIGRNEGLVRALQFPRALLPISSLVGQSIAFVPALLILLVVSAVSGGLRWSWLVFPIVLVAQALIGLGGAFIAARAGFAIRDVSQILPHLFRLLFYVSGVLFSVRAFVDDASVIRLFEVNPMFSMISAARWCLLGTPISQFAVLTLLAWVVLLPVAGFLYFVAAEHRYGS
ncbi:MAG: ABC transporter permease [Actinomycetota bacterium]